jgi:protein SCO1
VSSRRLTGLPVESPLNHTLRVYLIDQDGRIRNIYSSGTLDLRLVLADVKTLLLEKKSLGETSWH